MMSIAKVAETITKRARAKEGRLIVSISGAPGSGKSTLADALSQEIDEAIVVPMDGFHFDNAILDARGLRATKGAANTFDVAGYISLLQRLRSEDEVIFPIFDRVADLSRGSAGIVEKHHKIILAEGNYLLLENPPWDELINIWDFSIHLRVPMKILEERLLRRWTDLGLNKIDATARAMGNDIPNADFVIKNSRKADIEIEEFLL